jgi:hypothetical protein
MGYNNTMKNILKKVLPLLVVLFMLLAPVLALNAQVTVPPPSGDPAPAVSGKLKNPIPNIGTLEQFIGVILRGVIKVGIPLVVIMIIYSGFLFVTALGNTEKLTQAKSAFMWSLIGTAVLLGSWAIAELIVDTVTTISDETGMLPHEMIEFPKRTIL